MLGGLTAIPKEPKFDLAIYILQDPDASGNFLDGKNEAAEDAREF